MSNRKLILVTLIIATCLGLSGCGKKEEVAEAAQEAEVIVQEDVTEDMNQEVLTPEQEEYLELVAEIDVLQQKKSMILSYYNNPEVVMPIEQNSKLMSAQERLSRNPEEDGETKDDAHVIQNMRTFWVIYDNLKGSANPDEIPDENLDQVIQELKTQKSDLETEVSALEEGLRR